MAKTATNLYRHFTNTPKIIYELDKQKFTKYELTRYLRVRYPNFNRLFTNPMKHLKFHHIVRISHVTGVPIPDVAEMFYRDMSGLGRYKKELDADLAAARADAERNYKFAAGRHKRVNKTDEGYEDIPNKWDYDID